MGGDDFANVLVISLINGRVFLSFQNFGISQEATSSRSYNDGLEHTLQFTHFSRNSLSFNIDGKEQPTIIGPPGKYLSLNTCTYLIFAVTSSLS